jgi:MoxR-like ATPase
VTSNPLEPPSPPLALADRESACAHAERMRAEIRKVFLGQEQVLDQALTALIAAGHVLIEGVPGLGKTLLVRALARTFRGETARIQFTPDLMPADVMGHVMYDMRSGEMRVRRGPVFTNVLLADEINRAPAKTQAALLEVMQEHQVTLEGQSLPTPEPFMTLATQNPIEQEGTYPLPEAQLDRFLMKIRIEYPQEADEVELVRQIAHARPGEQLDVEPVQPVVDADGVRRLQQAAAAIQLDTRIVEYAVRLVRTTRKWAGVAVGAGSRGALALVRCARAHALLEGRDFVVPDDIKDVALPVLRHRILLVPEAELEGQEVDESLRQLLEKVEAPRT